MAELLTSQDNTSSYSISKVVSASAEQIEGIDETVPETEDKVSGINEEYGHTQKKVRLITLKRRIDHLESEIEELIADAAERAQNPSSSRVHVQEKLLSAASSARVVSQPIDTSMEELRSRAGQISVRLAVQDLLLAKLRKENDILSRRILQFASTEVKS